MTKGKDMDKVIAGYLDVKVPVRGKKRPFGLWKCWRRHWVEARRSGQLLLSPSPDAPASALVILPLPAGATLCRTASRSRQFAFGFVLTEQTSTSSSVYLAAKSETEAEHWITVLRNIALASEADLTPKHLGAAPTTTSARDLLRGRRLSRSESDLLVTAPGPGPASTPERLAMEHRHRHMSREGSPSGTLKNALRLLQLHGRRRADTVRDTSSSSAPSPSHLSLLSGKIASGLISASLGLMLSTPGGSEVEDNDEEDIVDSADDKTVDEPLDRRRESAVSIASGIYEEIKENTDINRVEDRLYENTPARRPCCDSAQYEDPALLWSPPPPAPDADPDPPPLPPRSNLTPISKLIARPTDFEDYVSMQRSDCLDTNLAKSASHSKIRSLLGPASQDSEPDYLPMSPGGRGRSHRQLL